MKGGEEAAGMGDRRTPKEGVRGTGGEKEGSYGAKKDEEGV